jgi:ubiquinone/menaquinone biosynthesis C-methylase UbiE
MDERREVQETYDEIADHFAKTRAYPWPEVEAFLDGRDGETALDVGCGNGRHAELLATRANRVLGVDISRRLLETASERLDGVALVQADAATLPLSTGTVDLAVYVATLHHLPDRETRVESLAELARVLADGGVALVSAWSTAHDRFDAGQENASEGDTDGGRPSEGFDTTVDWTLPGGETVPRFYHIYAPAEFERDLRAGGLAIESSFVSSGNCYARVEGKRP